MTPFYSDPLVTLYLGDCLDVMAALPADSVDAVCTDPPYGISFMGRHWDHGVPAQEFWGEMLRVAKPGAYLLAFGGTRTVHRIATNIEDAGWIIRDMLMWIYASGFPKGKANLKPAHEPIVLARKPGPLRPLGIDAGRIGYQSEADKASAAALQELRTKHPGGAPTYGGGKGMPPPTDVGVNQAGRWPSNVLLDPDSAALFDEPNPWVVGSGATNGGGEFSFSGERADRGNPVYGKPNLTRHSPDNYGDSGGYSRFFAIPTRYNEQCARCGVDIVVESSRDGTIPDTRSASVDGNASQIGSGSTVPRAPSAASSSSTPTIPTVPPSAPTSDDEASASRLGASSTNATEQSFWSDDDGSTPSTPRSKRPGTSPASGPPSSSAKSQDAAKTATDITTTTPVRWMCGTCAAAITSPTTSDSDEPRESYPRYLIIPKADRTERERGLAGAPKGRQAVDEDIIEFVHPAPDGVAAWLKEQREAKGLTRQALAPLLPGHKNLASAAANISNWEHGYNRPTPEQWKALREAIGFDDRYDEVMTTTRMVSLDERTARSTSGDVELMRRIAGLGKPRANHHPTVKPIDLMRHLVKLVTPPGGVILDPFAGSGTTGLAASELGVKCIMIEREPEYMEIIKGRLMATPMGMGLNTPGRWAGTEEDPAA